MHFSCTFQLKASTDRFRLAKICPEGWHSDSDLGCHYLASILIELVTKHLHWVSRATIKFESSNCFPLMGIGSGC